MYMKKIFSFLMVLVVAIGAMAKDYKMPQYDITGAGSGNEGTLLVKIFVYAKKNVPDEELKRAAVHGVVFRGCTGNNSGATQPPMASPSAETEHSAYCEAFFATDGQCQHYASIISGSYERIKTGKGYKYGAIIQINKSLLRRDLEKAGIVRSLSSGF